MNWVVLTSLDYSYYMPYITWMEYVLTIQVFYWLQVVKAFLIPFIQAEGERLQYTLESSLTTSIDRIAAEHVKTALLVGHFAIITYPVYRGSIYL